MRIELSSVLVAVAFCVMSSAQLGCATNGGGGSDTELITGKWAGNFTTDNAIAPKGTFTFDLTEDPSSHAVSGSFTGLAAGSNLAGTLAGTRSGAKVDFTVTVTAPLQMSLAFPGATIDGDSIAGNFAISTPVTAKGDFTIMKQ